MGPGAERPLVTIVIGVILAGLALTGPIVMASALIFDEPVSRSFIATVAFIVPALVDSRSGIPPPLAFEGLLHQRFEKAAVRQEK
jgi:hypothetical protein